jgi:protein-S-isoprenylcysteine O-methyltransferase Ste14
MRTTTLASSPVDIAAVQTVRKIVLLVAITTLGALCIFTASRWSEGLHEVIEWGGRALIFICISGRTWCSLYIGGRKNYEIVMLGPYSVCRNPLYAFSILGAIGIGAQLGEISTAIVSGVFAWVVFRLVVLQEERLLLADHGDTYRAYVARVPRFLPRLSQWKNVDLLEVRPRAVVTTFVDACFFIAAIPIAEFFEHFQNTGTLHVFMRLP